MLPFAYATGLVAIGLDRLAPARGALAHIGRIAVPGAGLAYVTRLPGRARSTGTEASENEPTHVLLGDRALPLPRLDADASLPISRLHTNAPGLLRRLDGKLWLDGADGKGLQLNGKPVRLPARLGLGDRIECEGTILRLIAVVPEVVP